MIGLSDLGMERNEKIFFFFSFLNLNFYFRLLPGGWRPTHVTDHRTPWPCSVYFPEVQNPRAGEAEGGGSRRGRARRLVGCGKLYHQPPPWEVPPAPPPPRSSAAQISHFLSWAFWQILCLPRASSPHLLPGEFFLPWVSHSAAHPFLCLYLVATQ